MGKVGRGIWEKRVGGRKNKDLGALHATDMGTVGCDIWEKWVGGQNTNTLALSMRPARTDLRSTPPAVTNSSLLVA